MPIERDEAIIAACLLTGTLCYTKVGTQRGCALRRIVEMPREQIWEEGEIMLQMPSASISVAPNASQVRGTLKHIMPEGSGRGSTWEIAVDEACDIDGLPNFAQAYVGTTIHTYIHPQLHFPIAENDKVQARVAFRGDERGGCFVLIDDDVQRL